MNFRNSIATSTGQLPSQKVFSYKPKTILDLLNPKNHYKQHLTQQAPNDEVQVPNTSNKSSKDELDKLTAGDTVWYKNHNKDIHKKWILVIFLKKISLNTFQVSLGSAEWIAHRTQLKPHHEKQDDRPNLVMPIERPAPHVAADYSDVEMLDLDVMRGAGCGGEGLFRGFPELAPGKSKRRKRDAAAADLSASCPRRSKRTRKPASSSDYVYQ